jgi:hypothetical protein
MDVLGENYVEVINSYTKKQWKPLLDLIPIIENTEKFGEVGGGEKREDGSFTFPYSIPSQVVCQFRDVVNEIPIIIGFDWGSWAKFNPIVHNDDFDFDTIDIPAKCMAISTFVRADRFCDGVLVDKFEKGVILSILKSIENQM